MSSSRIFARLFGNKQELHNAILYMTAGATLGRAITKAYDTWLPDQPVAANQPTPVIRVDTPLKEEAFNPIGNLSMKV